MIEIITTLSTNTFRLLIFRKFIAMFLNVEAADKVKEKVSYAIFIITPTIIYVLFHFPPVNVIVNILLSYMVIHNYNGEQKKKLQILFIGYSINALCDIAATYALQDYNVGKGVTTMTPYLTVLLFGLCEFVIERFWIKNKKNNLMTPYWQALIVLPIISVVMVLILIMNNLNNQVILVSISVGLLLINFMVFYLYDGIIGAYTKLEENATLERQNAIYSNQLDVLAQSEANIRSLRHDMKHHLSVLLSLAGKKDETIEYIQNMQTFMENPYEYVSCGNKEIDSMLNFMLHKAKNSLKQVVYKINVPQEMDIRPFDLNIIIGNLMDNAITAANMSEEKWLSVTISFEKSMLFINIRNSYASVNKIGDEYISNKGNAREHGIGLKNVKRVVEEYNGNLNITDTNKVFDVKVMLYMSMKSNVS